MRFGHVEGLIAPPASDQPRSLRLTVVLTTAREIRVVREEEVPVLRPIATIDDLAWHVDQFTQETIGTELAAEGWEAIGVGEAPESDASAPIRSATYAVRNMSFESG